VVRTSHDHLVARNQPFGSPEGERSDFRDPIRDFIPFTGPRFRSGLGLDPHDRTARVIVGRKGAGKTLYLRRLQDAAAREKAIYADDWQTSIFRNDHVIRMLDWYRDESRAVDRWEEVWRCAILRSVVSHILHSRELETDAVELAAAARDICPEFLGRESIYSQVSDIVGNARHVGELDAYLGDRRWERLARAAGETLARTKPICFYLDALDERFQQAPRHWLICQLGLFNAVMNFLRDTRVGPRLHIVIGVRDIVFSSTQMTEHATKYLNDTIRTLGWDWPAVDYFLEHKLGLLDSDHCMEPDAENSIQRWLGLTTISNEARQCDEDVKRYLLRHTRLIPRDVVVLGNMLCGLIDQAHHEHQPFLSELEIRQIVRQAARRFGQEELCVVANHLTAEAMPSNAADDGYADFYTGGRGAEAFPLAIADRLAEMLAVVEHDRFGRGRLDILAEDLRDLIDTGADPLDVLWLHGLIGHIDGPMREGRVVFYSAAREDRLSLPRNKRAYALHPIMIDTIDGIRGIGEPVEPY
jgi:hypothetical protein